MKRLSNMNKSELIDYVDGGQYCDQDVIDLYDDLRKRETEIEDLKSEIRIHRSNNDSDFWEEQKREWLEDGLEE
ncbi:hypothetical protein GCM10023310_69510 [Paenibacillus vulneris]|uniref:Uncharacterized protein n=1 Tax=Paenibacillus vulneris TaxID=1133364 RepID=A0ABW3UJ52_9BACL